MGALWETSAAIVAQDIFGWSVISSCLFIALCFFFSLAAGEAMRAFLNRVKVLEAKVVFVGYALALLGSVCLYWYIPNTESVAPRIANETFYIIGSGLVLTGANASRSYSTAIGMRKALSISKVMKDQASVWQTVSQTVGRAVCALLGMAFATLPGGANAAAGSLTLVVGIMMCFLLVPGFYVRLSNV